MRAQGWLHEVGLSHGGEVYRIREGVLITGRAIAKRLLPNESDSDTLERLDMLSNNEFALLKISCSVCHLLNEDIQWIGRSVVVSELREQCQFCKILHECKKRFAPHARYVRMYCQQSITNIQLCFRENSHGLPCMNIHVQLYSLGSCHHLYQKGSLTLKIESTIQVKPFRTMDDFGDGAGSEASVTMMKKWIDRCSTTHDHGLPKRDFKPSRLIRLAKYEMEVAQLYSPTSPVRFAALSYRWGADSESMTLGRNIVERYGHLEISSLPKTLQDAIIVTRRLGLEYIWIDRICIVQDDPEDWTEQASLMAKIYASAHVVLSATATRDCSDGFLRQRAEPLALRYKRHDGEVLELRAIKIDSHSCDRRSLKTDYELFKRGWCFQERLLARRIIHFLPNEILFECQAELECQCGTAGQGHIANNDTGDGQGSRCLAKLQAAQKIEGLNFGWSWMALLWEYSKMKLTRGEDSLPALSGLAACMGHLKPGKYIAGLWEHDIAIQLGWRIKPRFDERRWEYRIFDVQNFGPTFSWSSHAYPMLPGARSDTEAICTLVSSHVTLVPPATNPYGQVESASISMLGRVMSGKHMLRWFEVLKIQYNDLQGRMDADLDSEFDFERLDWEDVECFGLYEYSDRERKWVDTLLVRSKKFSGLQYVRIGVFRRLDRSWFNEYARERTITVV